MSLDVPENAAAVGLAIDTKGDMWSGLYNGSALIKIDPIAKAIVDTIHLSTPLIAAPAFGGPNMDVLFVPTANLPVNFYTGEVDPALSKPPAGNLFMVHGLSAGGVPPYQPRFPTCC